MKKLLIQIVKKVFHTIGYEIHRKSTRRTMASVLEHAISLGLSPQTVLDVGVAKGTPPLYKAFPHAYHLLIEPLEEFENNLRAICHQYKGDYILAGAGKKEGTLTINVHADPSASSLFKEADGEISDGVAREIPIITLDKICEQRHLNGPYVLKIDTQGAEIGVMEGASKVLQETELIMLEVSLFEFFNNGPQFYDIVTYMKSRGFVAYDFFGGHNRLYDNALAQIDVAFVKESGFFRKTHVYATEAQRKKFLTPR